MSTTPTDARTFKLCPSLTPALLARQLRKRLGSRQSQPAVDGVDLAVHPGEVVGLLGPNGAGKTTLLHLLAGVLAPDEGSIHICGEKDPTRAATRSKLGFAPQSTAVYDELTASENLVFFGRMHALNSSALRQSVDRALAFAALADRRDHRVSTFSGGMKRRLHVAAAIVHAPAVLLLDEPTVGVDASSRATLLDGVRALRDEGCAVVYASHHLDEVQRVCDRAVLLSHGRVVADDAVEKVAAAIDLESTLRSGGDA